MPLDLAGAKQTLTIPWESAWVTTVAFVGATRRLAAGNREGQLFLWDIPEKPGDPLPPPARRLDGHTNAITGLAVTPDGKRLISTSYDHTVRYWDLEAPATGTDKVLLDPRSRAETAKKAGKPADTTPVKVEVQQAAKVLDAHKDWVRGLALSADGTRLLTGDDHGQAILWDVAEAMEVRRLTVKGWNTAIALSPDGKTAFLSQAAAQYTGRPTGIQLWDLESGKQLLDLGKDLKINVGAAVFSPDAKLLAVGQGFNEGAGKLFVLDAATGKKVRDLGSHANGVTAVSVHPGGKHFVSSGRDTLVKFWQIDDGKLAKDLGAARGGQFKDWIHAVAFTADGLTAAAADMAGQINIWTLA